MTATASPATTLTGVVVTNEQTRALWRAGRASIVRGRFVLPRTAVPEAFLDRHATTFSIVAIDGAGRTRRFDGLTLDPAETGAKRVVLV